MSKTTPRTIEDYAKVVSGMRATFFTPTLLSDDGRGETWCVRMPLSGREFNDGMSVKEFVSLINQGLSRFPGHANFIHTRIDNQEVVIAEFPRKDDAISCSGRLEGFGFRINWRTINLIEKDEKSEKGVSGDEITRK